MINLGLSVITTCIGLIGLGILSIFILVVIMGVYNGAGTIVNGIDNGIQHGIDAITGTVKSAKAIIEAKPVTSALAMDCGSYEEYCMRKHQQDRLMGYDND